MIGSSLVGVFLGVVLALFMFWSVRNPKPLQRFFTTSPQRTKRGFILWSVRRTQLFAGFSGVFGVGMAMGFVVQLILLLQQ